MKPIQSAVGGVHFALNTKVWQMFWQDSLAPSCCASATIPQQLISELSEVFGTLDIIKGSVLRDNIFLDVREKPSGSKFYDDLAECILRRKEECGILYSVFPSDVSKIHSELLKRNVNCVKYHGQLSQLVKDSSYHMWESGEVKIMVANTSFGMGVDNKNVKYVIHAKMPTNLDEYFQQWKGWSRWSTKYLHFVL